MPQNACSFLCLYVQCFEYRVGVLKVRDYHIGARQVGHALPESLRETALGGIAATPTACRLAGKIGCGGCG